MSNRDTQEWTDEKVLSLISSWAGTIKVDKLTKEINAALADERLRYRKLVDAERRRCFDLEQEVAAERKMKWELAEQLEAAQAAIVQGIDILSMQNNAGKGRGMAELAQRNQQALDTLRTTDTVALDAYVAEKLQPLVDALKDVRGLMLHAVGIGRDACMDKIDAALAKVGKLKTSPESTPPP